MKIYALTPTGLRPEGLALLGEYLDSQTYLGPLTWIIVDDCDPATRIPTVRANIDVQVIRPEWRWKSGMNTQVSCLRLGLELVPKDAVLFVMEDDDAYLPDYIAAALRALVSAELVGEMDSHYYNVATGHWRILKGTFHSSLAATSCRGRALTLLRELCGSHMQRMLDVNLWRTFRGTKNLMSFNNVVGIKGLPGRPGIGVGHRRGFGQVDSGNKLKDWVGPYVDNYTIFREAA